MASRSTRCWPSTRAFTGKTTLASLQVGLSTPLSNCDGSPAPAAEAFRGPAPRSPCTSSSIPSRCFIESSGSRGQPDPTGAAAIEAQKRLARNKSVLDAVLENAQRTRARLGASDQRRMDEFLDSVRAVERRVVGVSTGMGGVACALPPADQLPPSSNRPKRRVRPPATYNKGAHADAMNDLIAMAFECDVTRVISYMLEDERSEFTYDHVQERAFTAESSSLKGGTCPEYHAAQHDGGDVFASITWWNVGKVADLCRKLDAIKEGQGHERPR